MRLLPDDLRAGERDFRSVEGRRRGEELRGLARQVRKILAGDKVGADRVVPTGWRTVDRFLGERAGLPRGEGGLVRGAVHEWFGVGSSTGTDERGWSPPLAILVHLARAALGGAEEIESAWRGHRVLWVGRAVWPYPRVLVGDTGVRSRELPAEASDRFGVPVGRGAHAELVQAERARPNAGLLERSVMLDVARPAARLWAIDAALRCPSVAAVVADGTGLDMASSRRLQLAAEARGGFALLARPPREESVLSAAATRFRVRRGGVPADPAEGPGWSLEVLRCKSVLGFGREQQAEGAGERGLRGRESAASTREASRRSESREVLGGSRGEVCVESSP